MASNNLRGAPPLFAELSKILSGDIDCSPEAIESHSTDGSLYAIRPLAVLYPKNSTDIKHIVAFSQEHHIPLTVRGGGTAATGGSLGEGVIMDMARYLTNIHQVNMAERTVTVDAGATLRELQEKLLLWNMEIPVLHGKYEGATVGGFVSTKSATASSFYTGTVREWVEGMTVTVDTGEEHTIKDGTTPSGRLLSIYQSVFPVLSEHRPTLRAAQREESDDATGYSLWSTSIGPRQLLDQLVGSEGTLGIITSVTFRVTPSKRQTKTILLPVPEKFLQTSIDIMRHHKAEALYMFDSTYKKLMTDRHPGILSKNFPDFPFYLLATLRDSDAKNLSSRIATLLRALPSDSWRAEEIDEKQSSFLVSHESMHELLLAYSQKTRILATLGEGIIVPKTSYGECLRTLDEALHETGMMYVLYGHAGSGHIAVTALTDPLSSSYEEDILSYNKKICSIVESFNGGLSAVGGDGLEKSAYTDFVYNEATLKIFSLIKKAWDPLSIFNPSKKIAVSLDYLKKHLRHA